MASNAEDTLAAIAQALENTDLSAESKNEEIAKLIPKSLLKPRRKSLSQPTYLNGTDNISTAEKIRLITDNLQETINLEIIEDVLTKENRPVSIYWGTATTGRPHCAYFVPMLQLASFLKAGCKVIILLADMHGFLDNLKAPIELVKYRAEHYKFVIVELLKAIGVPIDRLEFVLGSSYQLSEKYQMDLLRLCTIVTMHDARKAGSEVVKQVENATLSGLIYPLMQSLDEEYLGVDAQFGGVDQRKIFTLAKDILPKVGYKQRAHLMNPMVPGLAGGKMSASDPNSKIDVLDKPSKIQKKIRSAFCEPGVVKGNGLLSFVEYVLLPASQLRTGTAKFVVNRKDGEEPLVYSNIEEMHRDYLNDTLSPQLLKDAVTESLTQLLASVRATFEASPEWQKILDLAYPPEIKKDKPKKAPKDKGSRHPGTSAANVETEPDGSVSGPDQAQVNVGSSASEALQELDAENKNLENV